MTFLNIKSFFSIKGGKFKELNGPTFVIKWLSVSLVEKMDFSRLYYEQKRWIFGDFRQIKAKFLTLVVSQWHVSERCFIYYWRKCLYLVQPSNFLELRHMSLGYDKRKKFGQQVNFGDLGLKNSF